MKDYLKQNKNIHSKKNFKEYPIINFNDLLSAMNQFFTHDSFEFEDEKLLIQTFGKTPDFQEFFRPW